VTGKILLLTRLSHKAYDILGVSGVTYKYNIVGTRSMTFQFFTKDFESTISLHIQNYLIDVEYFDEKKPELTEYSASGMITYELTCSKLPTFPPVVWDNSTIAFIAFSQPSTQVCTETPPGPRSSYNVTTLHSSIDADVQSSLLIVTPSYLYLINNKNVLIKIEKQFNLKKVVSRVHTRLSNLPSSFMVLNETTAILLDAANYAHVNLKKMTIEDSGEIPNYLKDKKIAMFHKNTLYMINSEGKIESYLFEKTLPAPYRSIPAVIVVVIVTVTAIAICLLIVVLCFIRASYTRAKVQKEIEMRLLATEVPVDPNSVEEFMKKTAIIPIQELKFGSRISEGANGVVYKGTWRRTDIAIKRIKATDDIEGFIQECAILNHLRHMYVVLFLGISQDDAGNRYIITEFVENGSLDTLIYQDVPSNQILSFSVKLRILKQVVQGMIYLHSMRPPIIHRDLKPQNILLNKTLDAKICDFGVSKYCESELQTGIRYGTIEYTCPEILSIDTQDETAIYNEKCDVYSFGIIMHELFFMTKPYHPLKNPNDQRRVNLFTLGQKVINGTRPEIPFELNDIPAMQQWYNKCHKHPIDFNEEAVRLYIQICMNCWDENSKNRPSFDTLYDKITELESLL
jgi:tRNA A-37 threonylcarbamoyl transferase component Bud32